MHQKGQVKLLAEWISDGILPNIIIADHYSRCSINTNIHTLKAKMESPEPSYQLPGYFTTSCSSRTSLLDLHLIAVVDADMYEFLLSQELQSHISIPHNINPTYINCTFFKHIFRKIVPDFAGTEQQALFRSF